MFAAHDKRRTAMKRAAMKLALVLGAGVGIAPAQAQSCDQCILQLLQAEPRQTECESSSQDLVSIRDGLARLAQFLDRSALSEPHALLFLDIVYRWFGGERYADALKRYDQTLVTRPAEANVLRLFRRLMDRGSPLDPQDLATLTTDFDPLTARALHCDRIDLGEEYVRQLFDAASKGGYSLTHAALAWAWLEENHCALNVPQGFETGLVGDMAALIDLDLPVTDLEIETAALLHALGYARRVPPAFIDHVLAAQGPEGGFRLTSASSKAPNFHTSVLAFWLLLQHACPSSTKRRMIAGPDGH